MSESSQQEQAFKIVLGTGKTVLMRDVKIQHQELAAKAAAPNAGDNPMLLAIGMQKEMIKLLLIEVDGKALTGNEKEKLDSLFTYREYQQIQKVIQEITGGDDVGKFQMETVFSGNK